MKKEQQQLHFVRFISIKVKRGLYNIFKIVERITLIGFGLSYIWGEKKETIELVGSLMSSRNDLILLI